jgi:predicted nucleic acid-binding protein
MISLVEIESEIEKFRARRNAERAVAELDKWRGGPVAYYGGRIHPVDAAVARRAGQLMSRFRVRGVTALSNLLLAATAHIHDHGILTERGSEFRSWNAVYAITHPSIDGAPNG